jgi:hypothetical protein
VEMTVQSYMPPGWVQTYDKAPMIVWTETPLSAPAPAGPPPTWGEIATAIGGMRSSVESMGWARGTLYNFQGVCLQGSFLVRNGLFQAWAGEQDTKLGLAVAEHLWNVIRQVTSFKEGGPGYSPWQNIIRFNDIMCDSRDTALAVLDIALEEALRLAALDLVEAETEVEVEVEEAPAPAPIPVPVWIPGQFTGLLSASATTPELELASVGT